MSRTVPSTTRPFVRSWPTHHQTSYVTAGAAGREVAGRGGALVLSPLPQVGGGRFVFTGMDPSSPATYVRPWRPAPGMIAYLNFDGAQTQGETEMGGLWGLPANRSALAGVRPARTRRGFRPRRRHAGGQ